MAKSRGRKFAELVAPSNGIFDAASLPTIPAGKLPTISLSKLANSTFSVNSESASLGENITLDTGDITEHTSNKYFTDTRADARIAAHNLLARSGGTMTGNLTLGDNVNAYFGASTDLRIYHDGTNSHIINSTGELRFTGSNFAFKSDSAKLYFGLSDDLQIYHDGSTSIITDQGTGFLALRGDGNVSLQSADGNENKLVASTDGAVTIYYDNSAKFATTSGGVSVTGTLTTSDHIYLPDSKVLYIGAAPALALYHTGTNSHIQNSTGALINTTATFVVNNAANTETMLNAYENGAVSLYYDNAVKLATTSTGVQTTGTLNVNGAYTFPTSDGTNGQVLQTDGSGNLTFVTGGGGAGDITAVVAGTNLTGGATSGSATVNLATNLSGLGTIASGSITSTGNSVFNGSGTGHAIVVNRTDGSQALRVNDTGEVIVSNNYLYASRSSGVGFYVQSTAVFRGNITNDGSNDLSISSGTANINFNSKNFTSVGTIASGAISTSGNLTSTAASTSGILGVAYSSNYFGLKTSGQTLSSEYMIISADAATYISASASNPVYIRYGANDSTNQLIVGTGATGLTWRGNTVWTAENDGASSGLDADTVDGIQAASFLRSDTNDSVGTDVRHDYGPNSTWSSTLRVGGNGYTAGQNNATASVVTTNGNLHLDSGGNKGLYLNHYSGTAGVAFGSGASGAVAWMGPDGDLWKGSSDNTGSKYWHAGNDGTGSGLDADLLDGLHSTDLARLGNVTSTFGGTPSSGNLVRFENASGQSMNTSTAYLSRLECFQPSVNADAFMTFHVGSDYAFYFGIDGATNDLSVGGWSMGANKYKVWHENNDGASSGLYAQYTNSILGIGGISAAVGSNEVKYSGQISASVTGLFNASNNANGILRLNTHGGNYYHDLGFSSDGNMYHRNFTNNNAFTTAAWYKVWDASNDGSGSGLDADTVDGISSASLLRSDASDIFGSTTSNQNIRFNCNSGQYIASAGSSTRFPIEIYSPTANGGDAALTFHIGSDYAAFFGLASDINDLAYGGWSVGGTTKYRVWHQGNDGSGSGLDADLLDGLHGSSYMASTGMATNRDDYINLRVIRNNGSSAGSNGMYIGYGNAGSGATRLYGGGSTSNYMAVNASNITFTGLSLSSVAMSGTLTITNNSIRSASTSTWDGNPGAQGKIQYHANRWYIVGDSNSNRIVQFRRDGSDKSYIDNDGVFMGRARDAQNITVSGTLSNQVDLTVNGAFVGPTSAQNAENGGNYQFGYQFVGAWSSPYPDLVLGYHTGMRIGGYYGYGGTRIYADHPHRTTSILFSVGNGDTHVRATNNIYAYTSDKRLKENFRPIENAVDKVKSINGLIFDWKKDMMEKHDFTPDQEKDDAGLIAQEVQKIMPAAIRRAPFDHDLTAPNQSKSGEEFLTVQYEKMVPLLVEAIKEQQKQIDELKKLLEEKE